MHSITPSGLRGVNRKILTASRNPKTYGLTHQLITEKRPCTTAVRRTRATISCAFRFPRETVPAPIGPAPSCRSCDGEGEAPVAQSPCRYRPARDRQLHDKKRGVRPLDGSVPETFPMSDSAACKHWRKGRCHDDIEDAQCSRMADPSVLGASPLSLPLQCSCLWIIGSISRFVSSSTL